MALAQFGALSLVLAMVVLAACGGSEQGLPTPSETPTTPPATRTVSPVPSRQPTPRPTALPTATPRPFLAATPTFRIPEGELVFECPGGICVSRSDGSAVEIVAVGGNPAWSPEGARIAYLVSDSGLLALEVLDRESGAITRLATLPTDVAFRDPVWSPDGSMVAVGHYLPLRGDGEVLIAAADGSFVRSTSSATAGASVASWSPDSRHLAVLVQAQVGNESVNDLHVLDVETMGIRRVTRDDEAEVGAVWLDERTLIYSKGHEFPDLHVVDVLEPGDGLGRPVTEGGSYIGFIQGWIPFETSPTGRCVGALFQDRGYEIDEFDAVIVCLDENDTPVLRNLGPMATWAAPPLVWTPDGRYVVVRRGHSSPSDDIRFQDWIIELETGAESPFPVTPLEQPYPARWRPN